MGKSKQQPEPERARAGIGEAVPRAKPDRGAREHGSGLHRDGADRNDHASPAAHQLFDSKAPLSVRETSSPTRGTYLLTPNSLRLNAPVAEKPTV